jgi:hypothetical protein
MDSRVDSARNEARVNPLKLVKDEWRYLIAGLFTSLVIALSSALLPSWVIKPISEQILEKKQYDQFLPLVLRAGLLVFVASVALYGQEVLFGVGGERLGARLRREVYAALLRAGVGLAPDRQANESGPTSGGRAARVMSDVSALVNFFIYEMGMFVTQAATVVAGFVFLMYQNPKLTFGLMLSLVPLAWLLDRIGRGIENAFKANQSAVEGASGAMSEGLSRIPPRERGPRTLSRSERGASSSLNSTGSTGGVALAAFASGDRLGRGGAADVHDWRSPSQTPDQRRDDRVFHTTGDHHCAGTNLCPTVGAMDRDVRTDPFDQSRPRDARRGRSRKPQPEILARRTAIRGDDRTLFGCECSGFG